VVPLSVKEASFAGDSEFGRRTMTEAENKDDILKEDLYSLLEIESTATTDEIKRAWRRMAPKCHPDRNPDDVKAVALFLKIKKALDILTDPVQRKSYDDKYKARAMWEKKKRERDVVTQNLRDKLNERERAAKRQKKVEEETKINLEQEIAKYRKEVLRKKEQQEKERKNNEYRKIKEKDELQRTVKVKWSNTGENYSEIELKKIFSGFGKTEYILVGKKGKSAIVRFETIGPAVACERALKNHPIYHFDITLLNKISTDTNTDASGSGERRNVGSDAMLRAHEDYEKMVLENMRKMGALKQQQQTLIK